MEPGLHRIRGLDGETLRRLLRGRIAAMHAKAGQPLVVGLSGAQGGGKSTLARALTGDLEGIGLRTAVLSLDDLYLTRVERRRLAERVHPLLVTRGPPGTHDVDLGLELLDALTAPGAKRRVALPHFDKAADTRAPAADWPTVQAPVDIVLFEGWCVGAQPQPAADLDTPINALERLHDENGRWRRGVDARLAGDYRPLFARIDRLIFLEAPAFERVFAWRAEQEAALAAEVAATGGRGRRAMRPDELETFIMHYGRLTRWMLADVPARADIVVRLGCDRQPVGVRFRT